MSLFQQTVQDHYTAHGRDLPWRHLPNDPMQRLYVVLVSEIMLQQTQVDRVIPKYNHFLQIFPTIKELAAATLEEVLSEWSGLGYNRRARYLLEAARMISVADSHSWLIDNLVKLPGVGPNTAGAIVAYTYNQPAVFVETNIRTVYIHHFFAKENCVSDSQILAKLAETLPEKNFRLWYWALMDYGTYLKGKGINNTASKHYVKQSTFDGSLRQLRAAILRLTLRGPQSMRDLSLQFSDDRLMVAVESLQRDGLIIVRSGKLYIAEG